jgi:hypothetical protein
VSATGMGDERASRVGSAAEEASRLFEAVQEWARRTAGPPGPEGPAGHEEHGLGERIATGSPECQLCPLCQLIGLLRGSRPEIMLHLADAAGSLLSAVRVAIDAHEREWSARQPSDVERIDIT